MAVSSVFIVVLAACSGSGKDCKVSGEWVNKTADPQARIIFGEGQSYAVFIEDVEITAFMDESGKLTNNHVFEIEDANSNPITGIIHDGDKDKAQSFEITFEDDCQKMKMTLVNTGDNKESVLERVEEK